MTQAALPVGVVIIQATEGRNGTQSEGGIPPSPGPHCWAGVEHLFSRALTWDFHHWVPRFSGLQTGAELYHQCHLHCTKVIFICVITSKSLILHPCKPTPMKRMAFLSLYLADSGLRVCSASIITSQVLIIDLLLFKHRKFKYANFSNNLLVPFSGEFGLILTIHVKSLNRLIP